MRKKIENQLFFGQKSIETLVLDPRSRDDIPKILLGLKEIYLNKALLNEILSLIEQSLEKKINLYNGRPGMDLWKLFVMGTLRLGADLDYDRLHELVNKHADIRVMLLAQDFLDETWSYESIQENVRILTPEVLIKINELIVKFGHTLVKKKSKEDLELNVRCDSFVVETDVHFPTDSSLLFDASRSILKTMKKIAFKEGLTGWRQSKYLQKKMKIIIRAIGQNRKSLKRFSSKEIKDKDNDVKYKNELKLKEKNLELKYSELITIASDIVNLAEEQMEKIKESPLKTKVTNFINHSKKQIDQIQRRVFNNETIPSNEKVYSIFESHTEWISKGKAGAPQELGLKVCILEDQYQFILNHRVVEKQTDEQTAVSLTQETKNMFENIKSCSYDKGFYSSNNRTELNTFLDQVILPKKGKLSKKDIEIESQDSFKYHKRKHSGVESAINCLEHHGLDRCHDNGLLGFKRYVALAILAKNIFHIGKLIKEKGKDKILKASLATAA